MTPPKAAAGDFDGRFREIISDPINLLIRRVPDAGCVHDGRVVLHNGNRVALDGDAAYYAGFSRILVYNRGVHEPLEEYVFQELMAALGPRPLMLELGAYWAHYSMWLLRCRPQARVVMVEPDSTNIEAGRVNFAVNGYTGEFIQMLVGDGAFAVDAFRDQRALDHIDILHADIQGAELEMLRDCAVSLRQRAIGHVFVSTHSQELHVAAVALLAEAGYRIEVSSDFDNDTTSFDGFIFASSPALPAVLGGMTPTSRARLVQATPAELLHGLQAMVERQPVIA